jgi:hypothetical protein
MCRITDKGLADAIANAFERRLTVGYNSRKAKFVTGGDAMMSAEERVRILSEAKPNSWVAFSSDESRLVASGATYSEAVAEAEKCGEDDPVLIKIPENWGPRVFSLCA